jgi:DNA-binding GntR family transcriptional regulator
VHYARGVSLRSTATRYEYVHSELRREILRRVLAPGSRLRYAELAERFKVSQAVVREALALLAEQGLAVAVPQQGFRVRPLSLTDLDELTDARIQLESLVIRLAVERGDIEWESSVVAAHHRLANARLMSPAGELQEDWFTAHEAFHSATLRGCNNPRLHGLTCALRDAASLYRWWSHPSGKDYDRDIAGEHRGLLEAVVSRNGNLAAELIGQHIQRTSDALRRFATDGAASVPGLGA